MLFLDPQGRVSQEPPTVSILDHGFLFGDSIYEVLRFYDCRPLGWEAHRARLIESAGRLWLPIDKSLDDIEVRAKKLMSELGERDACLRMIITRGIGALHINTRNCGEPQIFMAAWKYEADKFDKPASLAIPEVRRNSRNALDPAIKSGNYLNSVIALRQAQDLGAEDAVLLNSEGFITELTTSNLGWIRGSKVYSPETDAGILHGVTRKLFLESHQVETGLYTEEDLKKADEIFVISTFKEILPVKQMRFQNGEVEKYEGFKETLKLRESFHKKILDRLSKQEGWYSCKVSR